MHSYLPLALLLLLLWMECLESRVHPLISRFVVRPAIASEGQSVQLVCQQSINATHRIYTIKYYKEQLEFWRFEPQSLPKIQSFPVPGIHVDVSTFYVT